MAMEIGQPVALRKLPRPAYGSGKVQFGSIWTLRPQSKRKRHEICTAVDGDSVNIYDIKTGRILLSHTVPPSTAFACPPTSARWKEGDQFFRQTCFAIRDDGLSLTSITGRDAGQGTPAIHSLRLDDESAGPVLHLDICSAGHERRIAVVQADGTLTFSTPDLQHISVHKLRDPTNTSTGTVRLIAATLLTVSDAQKSILKSRDDLSHRISATSAILVTVSASSPADQSSSLRCRAWSISNPMSAEEPQILFDLPLRVDAQGKSKKAGSVIPSFGPRASSLILKSTNEIQRIELTGLVPRLLPGSRMGQSQYQDILLIGSGTALVAFHDSIRLADLQNNAIYASLDLNQTLLRKKRKRSSPDVPGSGVDFVGYFPQISRVLIFSRNHLIACDLNLKESRRGPTGAPLLLDQIGKAASGTSHQLELHLNVAVNSPPTSTTGDWAGVRERLTAARRSTSDKEFEKTALAFWAECSQRDAFDPTGSQYSASGLTDQQVDFILSSLFSMKSAVSEEQQAETALRLDLIAPALIYSLNKAGILTTPRLKRALGTSSQPHGPNLKAGDIPLSLMAADATNKTLVAYVDSCVPANVSDVVAVVKILVRNILRHGDSPTQALLTGKTMSEQANIEAVAANIEVVATTDNDGAGQKTELLIKAISKGLTTLALLDTKTISTQLRTFSRAELLCLIQFLRQDLYQAGQAHLDSQAQGLIGDRVPLPVEIILKILSACIDAIDPLDLASGEGGEFLEAVISDLLSEVSLATDSAEESAHMQGTLRETLRHHQSEEAAQGKVKLLLQGPGYGHRRGTLTTLYSEDTEGPDIGGHAAILPLGLAANDGVSSAKAHLLCLRSPPIMAFPTGSAYHADSDADDEYERSVVASPTQLHPDSDTSSEMTSNEHTPTTFDYPGDDPSLPKTIMTEWTPEECAQFIASLSLRQYCSAFIEHGIVGEALIALKHDELKEMGIASVGHRLTILKQVYDTKVRQDISIEPDDYVPLSAEQTPQHEMATKEDIARLTRSILKLRDDRMAQAEAQLTRLADDYRKLRQELLPVFKQAKERSEPLPHAPTIAHTVTPELSPPDILSSLAAAPHEKTSLTRTFSKKLGLSSTPKNNSPTHIPNTIPEGRPVADPGSLDPSAAATAASNSLTAAMSGGIAPSISPSMPSPTSPLPYPHQHQPLAPRSYQREAATAIPHYNSEDRTNVLQTPPVTRDHDPPTSAKSSSSAGKLNPSTSSMSQAARDQASASPQPPSAGSGHGSGGASEAPSVEIFKSFRVSLEDPCHRVLPAALRKYNIHADWRQYALYIVYGDQERCVGLDEKPLALFKDLDKEGKKPMFMLRKIANPIVEVPGLKPLGSGGTLGGMSSAASVRTMLTGSNLPGGVL
ncbi:hypothetical protein DV735_g207, partial [Chaetothyriales sp. CBS 134920]